MRYVGALEVVKELYNRDEVCRERFTKPLHYRLRHAQMNLLESLIKDKEMPFPTLLMLADIVNEHREVLATVAKQLSEMPRTEDSPTE